MTFENYYDILGVHRKATPDQIKRAYRKLLSEWHPDHNPERLAEAEEKTKILNQAYHVLKDPHRRKQYDRMLRFTKGKDYGQGINEEAFKRKVYQEPPLMQMVMDNIKQMYAMYKDAIKGKYKLHSATLGMIAGGLLYFIMPLDFIPDFIPGIGFIDDLAVITVICHSLQTELAAYRVWKSNESLKK